MFVTTTATSVATERTLVECPPGGGAPLLAAEPVAGYDVARPGASRVAARLDEVAVIADERDRLMGRLVRLLVSVSDAGELADLTGGMSLHVWLQHEARCTRGEAREVLGAVDVLRAMPATLAGLADRWLSWSQAAAIARAARRVPVGRRPELDDLVSGAMVAHRAWEPDALVVDVWQWVDAVQPSRLEKSEATAERGQFATLQPNLFGGGSMYAELGAVGFAVVAEALDAPLGPPVALPDDAGVAGPRPMLLATVGVDALLDDTRTPGWLLSTLSGGRMKVSSATLQRLVDERGAVLRTVGADLDHLRPWPDGPTDVGNLNPVGRRWHHAKTSKAWTVVRARDGTTTWTHRRHGWVVRVAAPRRDLTDVPDPGPPRPPTDDRDDLLAPTPA